MKEDKTEGLDEMTRVQFTVTPQPPADGNEIECDITGGSNVVDDAIKLPKGSGYLIDFVLDDNTGTYEWAPIVTTGPNKSTPFVARNSKCPKAGKSVNGSYAPQSVVGTTLTVAAPATPQGRDEIIHYRLNFTNGETCDPIIIRD
jgi:hypothetical protein